MKRLIPLIAVFACTAAHAALPETPLTSQYTINTSETLTDSPYVVSTGSVLNIGDDAGGSGTLNVLYSEQALVFSGGGTINIGTAETVGEFHLTGTNENFPANSYTRVMDFSGLINVNEMGSFVLDGYYPSIWGELVVIGTLNLRGTFSTPITGSSNSYIQIKNLNLYNGANLYSTSSPLKMGSSSVWNLYSSGITTGRIRVGSSSTINLKGENVLKNVGSVAIDDNDVTMTMSVDNYSNVIKELGFNKGSVLNIYLDPFRDADSVLSILSLTTKDNRVMAGEEFEMNINSFSNDSIFIGDKNGITVQDDGRIYIATKDAYVKLSAYSAEGEEIFGDWSLDWNDDMGLFALNNTGAIPEPGACAAAFGVLALAYAARRRRN